MSEHDRPVADVVDECVATLPVRAEDVYRFVRNAMGRMLLYDAAC